MPGLMPIRAGALLLIVIDCRAGDRRRRIAIRPDGTTRGTTVALGGSFEKAQFPKSQKGDGRN
jgi:hypothetical protein